MILLSSLRLFFALLLLASMYNPAFAAEGAGCVSGTVVMEFDLSRYPPSDEVRLWLPYPVSDKWQVVDSIEISGTQDHAAVYTDRRFQNPILFVLWRPGDQQPRRFCLSFHVRRLERKEGPLPDREPCLDLAALQPYLAPTSLGPVTGRVKELADEITRGCTGVQAKARAIYDWICECLHRDPSVKGCGRGDVCLVLDRKGGKCVDLHSVFVALARAAGVPAREVFGIRLSRDDRQEAEITGDYHCWAEFYHPGYGWVVVDPADVTKAVLKTGYSKDHPYIRRLKEYFWGSVDPYRLRLSYGRDLTLNPRQYGKPLNYLMYPFAQVGTESLDWLEPKAFSYRITFSPDPSGARAKTRGRCEGKENEEQRRHGVQ